MPALTRGISQLATPFFVFQAKPSTIQRQRVGWLHYRRTPTQPMHDDHHKREHSLATSFNQHLHADLHLNLELAAHFRGSHALILYWLVLLLRFAESEPTPKGFVFSKEVIRPQVPLRPPCYDFSPVAELGFDDANKTPPRPSPTSVKRRAVCARSRDVFTARW
jgi:hypothetical protein